MPELNIYTIGWICAVGKELVAATAFLDEKHDDPDQLPANDNNTYILGRIGKHNAVIAALPHWQYGLVSAATVARDMVRSFRNVRIGLMVGIGGGVPSPKHDIRLGDIVVSSPGYSSGGVLQYDYGQTIQDASFTVTGYLNQPPQCFLTAISVLETQYESDGHDIDAKIDHVLDKKPRLRAKYRKPDPGTDRLYSSSYMHSGSEEKDCTVVCNDISKMLARVERSDEQDSPTIHYGLIASANQLMKDANIRDKLSSEKDVLCFEMEAAGLMNHFPCVVIRGICDYSDTHKNVIWQGYAAMAAAAYAKDLLSKVAPNKLEAEKKLAEILSEANSRLDKIFSGVENTQIKVDVMCTDKHLENVTKWLAAPDGSSNLTKAINARHKESGRWLIEGEAYVKWKSHHQSSFLWLHGIPGCGKTILTSTVIEDLQANQKCSPALLYFYFDFADAQKLSFENTVCSFIEQLYFKCEGARKHLETVYHSCENGRRQPSMDSLRKTFANMIYEAGEVWVVLDALDECRSRKELLSWIKDCFQSSQAKVHLLATSRPEQDIKSAVERYASDEEIIAIRGDLIKGDIRSYVESRVREHEGLSRWQQRPDIQGEIEATLLERANGMFRWVSCQLDALENCLDPKTLREAIVSLPMTLDETYARILTNIPSEHVHHTRRLLQILTYSERALKIEEAVDAIAVNVGPDVASGARFDPKDRMPRPEEITRYCSSLVVLIETEDRDEKKARKEIQLAHFSVKDYLISNRLEEKTAPYLEEMAARSSIAQVCLTYLLETKVIRTIKSFRELFPFAEYSAKYWTCHATVCERSSQEVFTLAMALLSNPDALESWLLIIDPDRLGIVPGLYYASLVGLSRCVERLIGDDADVNAQGGRFGNALQAASLKGYQKIVQMLLDAGVDVNAQNGEFGNALQAASLEGHRKIVQMLLAAGADVNAQGGYYGCALQAASHRVHQKIVQMLLAAGADVNAQGGYYGCALQAASHRGHQKIVQMLLAAGADVNAQGGEYGCALQAASYGGYQEIVQMLLAAGADVNAQGGEYGYALHAALYGGHHEIMQMLLAAGADVNAQCGRFGNALQAASLKGHHKILQMLLAAGADVNAQGGYYGYALHAALYGGHHEIVQMLLAAGADVNVQSEEHSNALLAASLEGHQKIVQVLLAAGADVNVQSGDFNNALHAASFKGHQEIVQVLLNAGADIGAQNRRFGNALRAASLKGHQKILQMLLAAGADVNAQGGEYSCALQDASYRGHEEIVQVLLNAGANVNAQGGWLGNALQATSYNGHQKIVQMLLVAGADVNAQCGRFGNALQAASLKGHQKILQMLLAAGADVNARGGKHGCALHAASYGRHQNIVRVLLAAGADVNAQGGEYGCALQAALYRGRHHEIVQVLLDAGADVNAQGGKYGCALQAASHRGHQKIVQMLLAAGADVNAQGGEYGCALQAALSGEYQNIVRVLLAAGAVSGARMSRAKRQ
ncbi:ankyrin repeat-containing domain protein [Bisporella sp. PMI_857]|nr:ankyrin repeat-containing domain protein [Bisporella sp. PMI_857]